MGGVRPSSPSLTALKEGLVGLLRPVPAKTLSKNWRRKTSFFFVMASPRHCGHYRALGGALRLLNWEWARAARNLAEGWDARRALSAFHHSGRLRIHTGKQAGHQDSAIAAGGPDRLR